MSQLTSEGTFHKPPMGISNEGAGVSINVLQGESQISAESQVMMTTLLGSCVAACLWDPVAQVGGMNHFLLPGEAGEQSGNTRYGINAMELLVNGLIKKGAERHRLQVKLFGGAKMFDGSANVGEKNVAFARWFMESEGIPIVMECLGGRKGRKIRFWPTTGRAQRMFLQSNSTVPIEKDPTVLARQSGASEGEIELF